MSNFGKASDCVEATPARRPHQTYEAPPVGRRLQRGLSGTRPLYYKCELCVMNEAYASVVELLASQQFSLNDSAPA